VFASIFPLVIVTALDGLPGAAPWFLGLAAHFVFSGLLALAYA
jgi:hypothetical protein